MSDTKPVPAGASDGITPVRLLPDAATEWDAAFRALERGLWAARGAAFLILISPVIFFFGFFLFVLGGNAAGIVIAILGCVWMLLFPAGWIAWGIGLRRLRRLAGSARARRDLGVALASMLAFPLCGLCFFIQTTPAGGVLTSATALILLGMSLLLTRVALEGVAEEAGFEMSRSLDIEFWPLIVSGFGLVMGVLGLLGGGEGWFVVAALFVPLGLLIAYFKGIDRCRELVILLRSERRGTKRAGA